VSEEGRANNRARQRSLLRGKEAKTFTHDTGKGRSRLGDVNGRESRREKGEEGESGEHAWIGGELEGR